MIQCKSSLTAVCAAVAVATSLFAVPLMAQAADSARVVIAFKAGGGDALRAAIANAGGRVAFEMNEVNALGVDLPRRAIAVLQRHAQVNFVEEGVPRYAFGARPAKAAAVTPAVLGEVVPYGIPMVQADQVSDIAAGNRKLCIVDSGIDGTHEDLQGITKTGEDFTAAGDPFTDQNSHGTHVAGTIFARDNSIGVIGVLPNAKLALHIAKVFDAAGSASSITIAQAMLSCMRNGANVVSMSLGGSSASPIEQLVVKVMAKRNMLIIAAAGNGASSAVSFPAGFAEVVSVAAVDENKAVASFSQFNSDVELSGPGVDVLSTVPMGTGTDNSLTVGASSYAVSSVIGSPLASVTAPLADFGLGDVVNPAMSGKVCLTSRGNIAFSDKVLNCQASGGVGSVIYNNVAEPISPTLNGVVTTIPSVFATLADGTTMLGQLGQSTTVAVTTSNYAKFSGTSMATPHVSAVAALVWSLHPTCTAAQMRISLDMSAQDLGTAGRDINYGFGLVQAKAAHDRITSMGCGI